jgi:uncharacterized membrane protein YdbT with pleckstrin-like domain
MSYIRDTLIDGEQVLTRAKVHWIVFVSPLVLLLVPVVIYAVKPGSPGAGLVLIAAAFCIPLAILDGLRAIIAYFASEFAITNKRVLIKAGFIRRRSLEVLLSGIEGIEVDQGIVGRLLNYGSIEVTGSGGSRDAYPRIAAPMAFRRAIQAQVAAVQDKISTQT